jgi:heme-degrading monooxygenase HmoA
MGSPFKTFQNMYVSVTSFLVKSPWANLFFQMHAMMSFMQARKSKGIIKSETFSPFRRVYSTLTHWESKEDMLKFRNSGAHLKAMQLSAKMGKGITTGWESDLMVDRESALKRLHTEKGSLISEHVEGNKLVKTL